MFRIYVNEDGEIPKDDICYIVAANGTFIKKKLDLVEALVPTSTLPGLMPVQPYIKLNIPKVPGNMFAKIVYFFREVYKLHKAEAVVLLHLERSGKYRVQIPFQKVTGGSVDYERIGSFKGCNLIGTIHSHPSFSAFHSGTDQNDEKHFDGLHITVGHITEDLFTISSSAVVNGHRILHDPTTYIDGLYENTYCNYFPNMFRPNFSFLEGQKVFTKDVKEHKAYSVVKVPSDPAWLNFVEKKESIVHIPQFMNLADIHSHLANLEETPSYEHLWLYE